MRTCSSSARSTRGAGGSRRSRRRLDERPAVRGLALRDYPFARDRRRSARRRGRAPERPLPDRERPYFPTLELPIVAGRPFDERDRPRARPVCIVNEAFARNFGRRSPIGQRLDLAPDASAGDKPVFREIVGVARQMKHRPDEPRTSSRSTCPWPRTHPTTSS